MRLGAPYEGVRTGSGRVEWRSANGLFGIRGGTRFATDSVRAFRFRFSTSAGGRMTKRTYITKTRLAALHHQLTPKDWRMIRDVDRLGLVSGDQLTRLHYGLAAGERRLARLHLARLTEVRIFDRLGRRVGGIRAGSAGFVYVLGVAGQRLVDPDRRRTWPRSTPGEAFLAHALAVSELYVGLREREKTRRLRLIQFDTEPLCWRRSIGPGGGPLILKPDAFAIVAAGGWEHHHFIELDRATESLPRIRAKATVFARYFQSGREQQATGLFPEVLWVAPNEDRVAALTTVLAALPAATEQLHQVCLATEAVGVLAGELGDAA